MISGIPREERSRCITLNPGELLRVADTSRAARNLKTSALRLIPIADEGCTISMGLHRAPMQNNGSRIASMAGQHVKRRFLTMPAVRWRA